MRVSSQGTPGIELRDIDERGSLGEPHAMPPPALARTTYSRFLHRLDTDSWTRVATCELSKGPLTRLWPLPLTPRPEQSHVGHPSTINGNSVHVCVWARRVTS